MTAIMKRRATPCLLSLAAVLTLTSSGVAARISTTVPKPCTAAGATPAASSLSSGPGPSPVLRGEVRVSLAQKGWIVDVPLGRSKSYVTQSFRAANGITIRFCLTAARGTETELVRLAPGGIALDLRRGYLALDVWRRGKVRAAAHRLLVTGRSTPIELALNGDGRRVDVYAGGVEQASYVGKSVSPNVVQIGSLTSERPGSITLTGVTVSTCHGQVIPAPAHPIPTQQGTVTTGAGASVQAVGASPESTPSAGAGSNGSTAEGSDASTGGSDPPAGNPCASAANATFPPAAWPGNPFSPTSFWNAPLAPTEPLDPDSQAYVNELVRQVQSYGPWMNTTANSTPLYVVGSNQPVQHVTLDSWGPDLQATFDAVPLPCNAAPAAGSDHHLVVWQPSTDKMWEFWELQKESDGWHTQWGGEMDDVATDPGYFSHAGESQNWGATATGLPLLGGLVTQADLDRGYINHALAISLVETARATWSWPAQRTDGGYFTPGITPIPEGTRFRLDPTLDIASLELPKIDEMLAQAAQTYGIVVRDKAGAVVFYGQDPTNLPSNPWPAAFGNHYPNQVLAEFPWSHLQALQTQQSCCWHP
jgi:hypothetical protein